MKTEHFSLRSPYGKVCGSKGVAGRTGQARRSWAAQGSQCPWPGAPRGHRLGPRPPMSPRGEPPHRLKTAPGRRPSVGARAGFRLPRASSVPFQNAAWPPPERAPPQAHGAGAAGAGRAAGQGGTTHRLGPAGTSASRNRLFARGHSRAMPMAEPARGTERASPTRARTLLSPSGPHTRETVDRRPPVGAPESDRGPAPPQPCRCGPSPGPRGTGDSCLGSGPGDAFYKTEGRRAPLAAGSPQLSAGCSRLGK